MRVKVEKIEAVHKTGDHVVSSRVFVSGANDRGESVTFEGVASDAWIVGDYVDVTVSKCT